MDDIFGQSRGTGYATAARYTRVDPDHVTYGRRISISPDGRPYEVWDPQVLAEFDALGELQEPHRSGDQARQ